jgi:maltose/moltooligosaccharide transporter
MPPPAVSLGQIEDQPLVADAAAVSAKALGMSMSSGTSRSRMPSPWVSGLRLERAGIRCIENDGAEALENWSLILRKWRRHRLASILAMPYAILASALPERKLGIYMGPFNVFVVVPQLLVATVMGSIMEAFIPTDPIWMMAFAAGVMALAALAMLRVVEPAREEAPR